MHRFEQRGLGKAPFRWIGCESRVGPIRTVLPTGIVLEVGGPGQPMGVCDYCGTGIAECHHIRSSDGKEFIVGSDCVAKTGDLGLKKVVNREISKARKQREIKRIEAARQVLVDNDKLRARLGTTPKPHKSRPYDSVLDWAVWMFAHAGHTGKLKVARVIEQTLAGS